MEQIKMEEGEFSFLYTFFFLSIHPFTFPIEIIMFICEHNPKKYPTFEP